VKDTLKPLKIHKVPWCRGVWGSLVVKALRY